MVNIKENYGPFSSRDEYENALMDWKGKDSAVNIEHYNEFLSELKTLFRKEFFDKDFPDDLRMLYTYYYSHYGCNYDKDEAEGYIKEVEDKIRVGQRNLQEINDFFQEPDPWDLKDMMDNRPYDESVIVFKNKLEERNKCSNSIKNIMKQTKNIFSK